MTTSKRFGSDVGGDRVNPFIVSAVQRSSMDYRPRLWGYFETSEDFLNTIEVLEVAEEQDTVELHVNSGGGSASAVSTLTYAMDRCKAPVTCIFTGDIASAGTFPLFHCDGFDIADDATFLFHEAIFGSHPQTASLVKSEVEFIHKWVARTISQKYEGFFTPAEIDLLLSGKQWFMFPEEVKERMELRNEYFKKKMETDQEDEQEVTFSCEGTD